MELLVIGTSTIARNHMDAFRENGVGFLALCGNKNIDALSRLASDFKINRVSTSWKDLIDELTPSAILVCTPPEISFQILKYISGQGISCLVEKPGITDKEQFDQLKELNLENTFMAFNRRFYKTVQELKSHIQNSPEGHLTVEIHEIACATNAEKSRIILENSIHVLDLILFITGNINSEFDVEFAKNTNVGFEVFFKIGKIAVTLSIKFGIPGNSSVSYDSDSSRIVLKPLEKLSRFNCFDIQEPTVESPIRRYVPSWNGKIENEIVEDSLNFKPGFLIQSRAFRDEILGVQKVNELCSIDSACASLNFAFQLSELLNC